MAVNEADILQGLDLGKGKNLFDSSEADPLIKLVESFVTETIESIKQILADQGRNASGRLSASISPQEIIISEGGVEVIITAEGYADFVDKGVKGAGFREGFSSMNSVVNTEGLYQFKNLGAPEAMITSIEQYLQFKGAQPPQGFPDFRSFATKTAMNVKARGIKPAKFIEQTFNEETINAFTQALNKIVKENR